MNWVLFIVIMNNDVVETMLVKDTNIVNKVYANLTLKYNKFKKYKGYIVETIEFEEINEDSSVYALFVIDNNSLIDVLTCDSIKDISKLRQKAEDIHGVNKIIKATQIVDNTVNIYGNTYYTVSDTHAQKDNK